MDRIRILLADDHAIVRAGIRSTLDGIPDFEVVGEAGDGRGLLASLAAHSPDLLIVDVAMPDFEPVPTIRELLRRQPALKILVISAYDDDIYVKGLLQVGVHGYHLKDQPLSDLVLAIRRVLAGERWLSSPLIGRLVAHREAWVPQLTARQIELMHLLQEGLDNQAIATRTSLSVKTVENHLTRLYRELNVQSRLEAVKYAVDHPTLLAMPGRMAARAAEPNLTTRHDGPVVLLVDDSMRYRQQLRRAIGKLSEHAVIYEAHDTEEAVRLAQRVQVKLAFIDVVLGDENGISCAKRIRAIAPPVRVILISAYPDREFHRQGLAAGAVAFIDKRYIDTAALRQILDDLANQG